MEPLDHNTLRRDLSAFADGELDPVASRRLLQQMLEDPTTMDGLRQIQQLTTTARRSVRDRTPPPSEALMERLRQMSPAPIERRLPARKLKWFPTVQTLAAGVLLAVGIWAGIWFARPPAPVPSTTADVLPASVVASAEEIHGFCSRLALGLHSAGYPANIAALAEKVEADLHTDHPYPDLMPIGYRYRGAGPCGRGLPETAHLLYRSVRAGSVNAVSVFVQPWHGQYPLEGGRLYTVSVAQSPFPMLAWRTEHVVYFLLADDAKTERAAVALIRAGSTTQPVAP